MLDEMFQQTASKFAIFLDYENPYSFFFILYFMLLYFPLIMSYECPGLDQHEMKKTMLVFVFFPHFMLLFFSLMNALVYVDIDQGHS